MATARLRIDPQRDLLSQAIVESLQSWPEYHRRVFIEIHYCGRPVEDVARSLGLRAVTVKQILERCELMLHQALEGFPRRNGREQFPGPPPSCGHGIQFLLSLIPNLFACLSKFCSLPNSATGQFLLYQNIQILDSRSICTFGLQ